jgi:hypothetical protein
MKTSLNALTLALLIAASSAQAAEVNPFTGTEASIADLKRQLEIAQLETQIAQAKANKLRTEKEFKAPKPAPAPLDPKFGTLKYPTEKLPAFPGLDALLKLGQPGKGGAPAADTVPAIQAAPLMPAGPRLLGVISDEAGRVAIIEHNGVLQQAHENGTAHGQKVSRIGAGWADVGGKRLTQNASTLALVANVDKQPAMRPAGASTAISQPMAAPSAQPAAFMPPGFPQ